MAYPFEQKIKDVLDYIQGLHLLPGNEKQITLEFDDEATVNLPDAESTWKILDSLKKVGAIVILEEKRWEFLTAKEFERMFGKKPYRCVLDVHDAAFEKYRRDFLKEGSVLFADQGSVSKGGVEVVPITKSTIEVKLPDGTTIRFSGSRARLVRFFSDNQDKWCRYSEIRRGAGLRMSHEDIKKTIREINQRVREKSLNADAHLITERTEDETNSVSERIFRWSPSRG